MRFASQSLAALVLISAALLGGCQHGENPGGSNAFVVTPSQRQVLSALGFVEAAEGWELNLGTGLLFDFDSDQLSGAQLQRLRQIAQGLAGVGIDGLRVEGHSDNVGNEEYNLRLSERRAEAVGRALAAAGMAPARLRVRGFGALKPIADNASEAGRTQNRRVTLIAPSA
ncbi:OmpA family protein [Paucibacter sediminis]|uniref:OmpA family protein n=1 Tax=Paucibacter sediminis TaxID=3019553 RepID=A0AA95NB18_9BURK|nr:OmpA family protein [Paucibacter sp. S2-9]WIT10810.1 OmpA family protein [Paucibacter sp. S2-9]